MLRSILVPLDGSWFAECALDVALPLARRAGASLELIHVRAPDVYQAAIPMYEPRLDHELAADDRRYLEGLAARVPPGVDVSSVVLVGAVLPSLSAHVARHEGALVVMTTHGRGGVSDRWLGSTADRLVRRSPTPVLLVRPHHASPPMAEPGLFRRILVPLDGRRHSEGVLSHAMSVAAPSDAELSLVTVVSPMTGRHPVSFPLARSSEITLEAQAAAAREYLEWLVDRVQLQGTRASAAVIVGSSPADAILTHAHEHRADLIALSARSRGPVSRLVLGSVADKLVRGATVPILVAQPLPNGSRANGWTERGRRRVRTVASR